MNGDEVINEKNNHFNRKSEFLCLKCILIILWCPYEKGMSGNCQRKCPGILEYVRNMSIF
jgi:hypothetical protein